MTHKEAQKVGCWFGFAELCWIDPKQKFHEKQFISVALARKHLTALVELGSVAKGTGAYITRAWREPVYEQWVPAEERSD